MKNLGRIAAKSVAIELLFEPRDLWIGVYWTRYIEPDWRLIQIYVTVVPMFPIRFSLLRKDT